MGLINLITGFRKKILTHIKKKSFDKGSIYHKSTSFDETANCANYTGNKSNISIGANCMIRCLLVAEEHGKIKIGDNCYLGDRTRVGAVENITIGNDVIISSAVHINDNNNHPTSPKQRYAMTRSGDFFGELWKWSYSAHKPVRIEDNVWIGERSTITKGVTIGKGSIVASNSVVTHDVPEYSIVAGNPAKVVKYLQSEVLSK